MECTDELNRVDESLNDLVPDSPNKSYDMMELVRSLADNGKILEYQARFAPNILTCLIRMGAEAWASSPVSQKSWPVVWISMPLIRRPALSVPVTASIFPC